MSAASMSIIFLASSFTNLKHSIARPPKLKQSKSKRSTISSFFYNKNKNIY